MELRRLWLRDFRNYASVDLEIDGGVTAIVGPNGQGKTNLLEAIALLGTLSSFRGASTEALVRSGRPSAVVRGEGDSDGRPVLVEIELVVEGRSRTQLNRRPARASDLVGALPVTVFAPDDLELVKGSPGVRRDLLDRGMVLLDPRTDRLRRDVERVLRQRNALLRQAGGRLTPDVATTLDVWDDRLARAGDALARARIDLVDRVTPAFAQAHAVISRSDAAVGLGYAPSWLDTGLAAALDAGRDDDVRRGQTLVGPHRDDLLVELRGLPARTHASQGEQRSLALALRLGLHVAATDVLGGPPVLLLDDVFSELDPQRSEALIDALPVGQTLITTAEALPQAARIDQRLVVAEGAVAGAALGDNDAHG